jgi:hypothetical protein
VNIPTQAKTGLERATRKEREKGRAPAFVRVESMGQPLVRLVRSDQSTRCPNSLDTSCFEGRVIVILSRSQPPSFGGANGGRLSPGSHEQIFLTRNLERGRFDCLRRITQC